MRLPGVDITHIAQLLRYQGQIFASVLGRIGRKKFFHSDWIVLFRTSASSDASRAVVAVCS